MIYQNSIITHDGQQSVGSVIQFGKGDIGIILMECEGMAGISLHNIEAREIGSVMEEGTPAQAIIVFSNMESLDVVIKKLKEVKKSMLKPKDEKQIK